ncbi:hypothetical protein CEP51_010533 [Fusarium floridanum]|uniref:Uncharacterized protein n=1 Tax=Fusarium floridanum TaxID=1325733 RepID=A0A428RE90_9HYPO|nr:hypothetical protein CEP51_010533 [Fusarium floridanum]
MSRDAYGTLGVCTSLAQQLSLGAKLNSCDQDNGQRTEITQLDLCWSGIVLLDRTIMLSDFEYSIPQSVGFNHQFASAAVGKASDEDLYGDDLPRKFVARAQVALQIGKILDAMKRFGHIVLSSQHTDIRSQQPGSIFCCSKRV